MKKLTLSLVLIALVVVFASAFRPSDNLGSTTTVVIPSDRLPKPMNVNIVLPEHYDTDTSRHFPVLYLLHGHGGNNTSWGAFVPLDSIATALDLIIVCPDGMNSWYFDSPLRQNLQMESFITKELVPYVDSHYRTLAQPQSRAITGLSMGGHGALWLAIRHKNLFRNAGSTSGGVDFTTWPGSWSIKETLGERDKNPEEWQNHTVASLVSELKPGDLNIIFDCGTEDFFYNVNCALDSALNSHRIPHVYRTSPGAHNSAYWARSIKPQLEYFNSVLAR